MPAQSDLYSMGVLGPESATEVARLLADMDEAATVSLVLADHPQEDPVEDDVPLEPATEGELPLTPRWQPARLATPS